MGMLRGVALIRQIATAVFTCNVNSAAIGACCGDGFGRQRAVSVELFIVFSLNTRRIRRGNIGTRTHDIAIAIFIRNANSVAVGAGGNNGRTAVRIGRSA